MGLTKPRASQIFDIDYKQATRVITVSNVTLVAGAPAVVDGVSLVAGDRVLVIGQSTASQNGLYYVSIVGSGSDGTWTRTGDGNETGEIQAGMIVMVTEGVIYADTQWKLVTDNPIVIGTTSLIFELNTSGNSLSNGTSNVTVFNNSNVTVGVTGNNIATFLSGGVNVTGIVSATGNITGSYIIGNGSQLTGLPASYSDSNVSSFLAAFGSNTISTTGNVTTGYILGNGSQLSGLPATYGDSNVVSLLGAFGSNAIVTTGNITGGNVISNGVRAYKWTTQANTAPSDPVPGDNWYNSYTNIKYQYTYDGTGNAWIDQSPPTSFGNITVTGNTTSGNVLTGGIVSAVGNITGSYIIGNGSQLTGLPASYSDANVATFMATFGSNTISTTGNVTAGGYVGTVYTNSIINTGTNATGNIGSSTTYFNTVFAKATSAQYADLAEMYVADQNYVPGTVVEFGGEFEITASTVTHSPAVAGIISTNPSYLMNSTQIGNHVLPVALTGRVPCMVIGKIRKGDRLVASALTGVATSLIPSSWEPGCIIGKSLEAYDSSDIGIIEVAVGRT